MDPLFTIDELADRLKVSRRTVYRLLEDKELPFAIKIKGSWRFRESDVNKWLESQMLGKNN